MEQILSGEPDAPDVSCSVDRGDQRSEVVAGVGAARCTMVG